MKIYVNYEAITQLFEHAQNKNRDFLFEYEVYELIKLAGSETTPKCVFIPKEARIDNETLLSIPGEKVVIKVVSPSIIRKSDVGGVFIVSKKPEQVLSAVRRMMYEIPENYAGIIERYPEHAPQIYQGLKGTQLITAIAKDIQGVILCQFMPPDSHEFGNELIVSLRHSREFGVIISAGLGGTDTELYAERFKKGQAVVAASTEMTDGDTFFRLFQETISYQKLAGLTRGHTRVVTDEQLIECFSALIALGNYFSPLNLHTPFVIEELEINPFAFTDYLMVPLDGLCRFSRTPEKPIPRPLKKVDKLLHPSSIGIIGVSAKEINFGRIILRNILANGFNPSRLWVIHPSATQIEGVTVVPTLDSLKEKLDLLILAVSADHVSDLVSQVIDHDLAESVILIAGGLDEKEGRQHQSQEIKKKIQQSHLQPDGGPVFLGSNCLGILSHPGRYDSLFVPDAKLPIDRGTHPRKSALISQSGAYMITRMSKLSFMDPAYAISLGNQTDLTAGDILRFINTREDVTIVASYMEGFVDLDGLAFAEAIRHAVLKGKEVLLYKAGRTPEGKSATSGHTASLAGDYMVCESCIQQTGAMVASTFTEFEGLFRLSSYLHHKTISGSRLAAVSNAGYEAVGIADNLLGENYKLELASFTQKTEKMLAQILRKEKLNFLVDVKNPMDVSPMATDAVYESLLKALLGDPHVDAVVAAFVPMTPFMQTLPEGIIPDESLASKKSIVTRLHRLMTQFEKPLVIVIDSGSMYDPLADALQEGGLPVFRSADQAVWILGKYIQGRIRSQRIRDAGTSASKLN
jgi:acyl-CoA synthetase (NDP forming)